MSIFRQKIEQKTEEDRGLNPSSLSGWAVKTSNVIETDSQYQADAQGNPTSQTGWYCALNNVSMNDVTNYLKLDSVKFGISIVGKSPGATRTEKAWINPKTFDGVYGGAWGKLGTTNTDGAKVALGDMVFTSGHNQAPTVIGMTLTRQIVTTANQSPKVAHENSVIEEPAKSSQTILDPTPGYGFKGDAILSKGINEATGLDIDIPNTTTGANGQALRVGVALYSDSMMSMIAHGGMTGMTL